MQGSGAENGPKRAVPVRRGALREWAWILVSAVLHVWFVLGPRTSPLLAANASQQPSAAWFETMPAAQPEPEVADPPEPLPAEPQAEPTPVKRTRARTPQPAVSPIPVTEGGSGVDVETTGEPADTAEVGEAGGSGAAGEAQGSAAVSGDAEPVTQRSAGPAQLSMWMLPAELERLVLLRPMLTLLMAVPGYREVFRGSSIRPFSDLRLLRVFLAGLRAERLVVAGVHARGEDALVQAADRVAAMRSLEVDWRGDSDLRATSWIDNSGIDRGFAVHDAAFVIGPRERLPAILGAKAPGDRVVELSKLRRQVVMACLVEDAGVYLPALSACGLQSLQVSVAARGDDLRMSLAANYASSAFAAAAAACLDESQTGPRTPNLIAWLKAASGATGSYSSQLRTSLSRVQVEHLFDEISAALRHAART